jgi:hypothetical protein
MMNKREGVMLAATSSLKLLGTDWTPVLALGVGAGELYITR